MKQDADKGRVAVHTFDPEASPQEKGAAAGKPKDQLKSVGDAPGAGERGSLYVFSNRNPSAEHRLNIEVAIDTGKSNVVPTITVQDVDKLKTDAHASHAQENGPMPPGGLPDGLAPAIPDWYKVGWRAASNIDAAPLEESEKEKTVLDLLLAEQYYGEWYHNAALIFFVRGRSLHIM